MRAILLLLLPLALSAQSFDQLVDRFFDQAYFAYRPSDATAFGFHAYDNRIETGSKASIDQEIAALQRFTKTIYLSQTAECRGDHLEHYLNLEDAMKGWETDKTPRQWRTHFHVPVFLEDLGPMKSTRFALEQALAMHKRTPLSRHLEIETYTWDVLPDHLKTGDIVEYVCRELEWVKGQLA